ncbi:MAG TPA: J domain-containing protein [Dehalococcoidia bacterium]
MDRNPFEVLDLPPDAGLEAARKRYRALAREHHPDTASDERRRGAHKAMAELNSAMEELERDFEGWRRRAGVAVADVLRPASEISAPATITVEPRLLILNAENGFAGYVTAAAPHVAANKMRLRFSTTLLTAERLPGARDVANFRIGLAPSVTHLDEEHSELLEVHADGCEPAHVRMAVSAFGPEDRRLPQESASLLTPALELALAVGAFAGALAIVVLFR